MARSLARCLWLCALCVFVSPPTMAVDAESIPEPDITFRSAEGTIVSGVRCGTVHTPGALAPTDQQAIDDWLASQPRAGTIPVAFHVIYKTQRGSEIGNVPTSWLNAQIQVLNDAYAGTGFSFALASIDRTNSKRWFSMSPGGNKEAQMKSALAINPATTLNIYTCQPTQNLLGWAYFPWDFPENSYWHGAVLLYASLPGGSAAPYDEGDTGTHEVGHYLGLYHTFQGGCPAPGDFVSDTAPEASPAFGCPIGRDTCAGGGPDPIENFMDYVDDFCMTEFTNGQAARMQAAVATYKPSLRLAPSGTDFVARGEAAIVPDPSVVEILRIAPNPFNPRAVVSFELARDAEVSVALFDVAGRRVRTLLSEYRNRGRYTVDLDGGSIASGVYSVVVEADGVRDVRMVSLIR